MLMKTIRVGVTILATAVAIAAISGVAQATPVAYTIDSMLSFTTSSGYLFSPLAPYTPQFPGSATAFFGGTLVGDKVGGTVTFSGGSTIDALPWGGTPFLPPPEGPEPDEDNIGLSADLTFAGFGVQKVAVRDVTLDIPAGSITDGAVPAAMTIATLPGSHADTTSLGVDSSLAIVLPNITVGLASIVTVGLTETITIPYTTTSAATGLSLSTGMIVASRTVPEPSTVVLAGLGVVGMALAAWRKRHAA